MSYLPCKNPSCKSFGRPHPNCKCYGDMANGGDVSFCSGDRKHDVGCEYYSDGGEIDQDSVVPDTPPAEDVDQASVVPDKAADVEVDPNTVKPDSDYESFGQQAATVAEGAAQGVLGPIAPYVETKLGVPAEDIAARERMNPTEHETSKFAGTAGALAAMPFTPIGIIPEVAEGVAELANLGKYGSAIVKGALTSGAIQGSDEATKAILGQADPSDAVAARIAGGSAIGGALSLLGVPIGNAADKAIEKIAANKIGGKITSTMAGFYAAAKNANLPQEEKDLFDKTIAARYEQGAGPDGGSFELYKKGQDLFNRFSDHGVKKALEWASPIIGSIFGGHESGFQGMAANVAAPYVLARAVSPFVQKLAGPASTKIVAPLTFKILSSDSTTGMLDALNHAAKMTKGFNMVGKVVDSLLRPGIAAEVGDYGSEKNRENLDEHIENGGYDQNVQKQIYDQNSSEPQNYAKGGHVQKVDSVMAGHEEGLAQHYPEQNILLNAAKGRISNYLSSIRPQENTPKLAFDDAPDLTQQKKSYNKALDLANAPLGIMREIKEGTLEPDQVKHFKALHPEMDGLLQRKITERLVKAQTDGEKPAYKIRQALSMYLGTDLSSEMSPASIQAAQSTFAVAAQQRQPQPATKSKKSTSSLSKSDQSFLSGPQALEKRSQRQS